MYYWFDFLLSEGKNGLDNPGGTHSTVGQDISVRIATRYGLEGPGIESCGGRDFPHLSRPGLGPTQSPVQWVPGLSWG